MIDKKTKDQDIIDWVDYAKKMISRSKYDRKEDWLDKVTITICEYYDTIKKIEHKKAYNLRHGKVGHNGDAERLNEARLISNAILRKEIGSTARRGPDGHIYIKLRNNSGRNNYENLARYVYKEKHQEDLTSNDIIMHIDGDLNNCDADNLIKVTRNERLQLARQFSDIKDEELLKTALNILKLKSKINTKKK